MTGIYSQQVPVFILAGGLGSRLSEETDLRPKPMVEIGGIPILVHLMRMYYRAGFNDFVICAGYRSWEIKSFFIHYHERMNHITIDHRTNETVSSVPMGRNSLQERWRVRVIDTGLDCGTGGRLARALDTVATGVQGKSFDDFAVTYGDGLSDVNLRDELAFHRAHGKRGTVLGVRHQHRFGLLRCQDEGLVTTFSEKPLASSEWVNGGFFFFKRDFREYLNPEATCVLEMEPLQRLVRDSQLHLFRHEGFWHPMDTVRDKRALERLYNQPKVPWDPDSIQ